MNYLIMETHRSYAVVLDEMGVFHFAANLNYQVGDRIQNPVLMDLEIPETGQGDLAPAPAPKKQVIEEKKVEKKEEKKAPTKVLPLEDKKEEVAEKPKRRSWLPTLVAVAAAALLFIGGGYYYTNFLMTYSSIAVSINPDVSIEINKRDEVIDVTGENPDGETMLADFDLNSKDKNEVLRQLVQLAMDKGYLEDGVEVSVKANSRSKDLQTKYQSQAERALSAYLAGKVDATVNGQPVGGTSQPPAEDSDDTDDEADLDDDDEDEGNQSQGTAPAQNTPPAQSQTPAQTQPRNTAPPATQAPQSPRPREDDDDDDNDDDENDDDDKDDNND